MNNVGFGGSYRRQEAQSLCDSLLGKKAPKVFVMGDNFYHRSIWADRVLIGVVCRWARANPDTRPDSSVVDAWVQEIQAETNKHKDQNLDDYIVIAALPAEGSYGMVSNGGAIHEIAHGLYTKRTPYTEEEIVRLIVDQWDLIPNWGAAERALLDSTNTIEDPRVERIMMEEYPGATPYITDLHKWGWKRGIKMLEEEFAKAQRDSEEKSSSTPQSSTQIPKPNGLFNKICVLLIALTHKIECEEKTKFVEFFQKNYPDLFRLTEVELLPILTQMRKIGVEDQTGALQISIEFVSILMDSLGQTEALSQYAAKEDSRIACPQCGSKNTKTVLHRSTEEDKTQGVRRGTTICKDCGAQWSERLVPISADSGEEGKAQPVIDLDQIDRRTKQLQKKSKSSKGLGGESDGESEGESEGESDDSDGDSDGESDDSDGDSDGESDDSDGESEGGSDDSDGDPKDLEHQGRKGDTIESIAEETIGKTVEDDPLVTLIQDSLREFVQEEWENELKRSAVGAPYRPYSPGIDHVVIPVPPNEAEATATVNKALQECVETTTEIRERLRRLIVSLRATRTLHGIKKGVHLSERRLADTGAELLLGRYPNKPFKQKLHQPDARFAAIVVIDQSGSMSDRMREAMQVMLAIVDPIDDLGLPVAAIGFQDSTKREKTPTPLPSSHHKYHRSHYEGVQINLFKGFDTPFIQTKPHFAMCSAGGGTPMAEGVQAALEWIQIRKEPLKFIFVVTDGCPNGGTESVLARQVHLATQKGILIVGVGVGPGTEGTLEIFKPHGIHVKHLRDVPEPLLNLLIDRIQTL